MMDCSEVAERILESLYGELPPGEERRLQDHLHRCPACREEFAALRRSRELLVADASSADRPAPAERAGKPEVDVRRILRQSAIDADHARRRWRRRTIVAAAAAVVVSLLVVLSVRVELHPSHVVISWGTSREETPPARDETPVVLRHEAATALASHERRLDELDSLLRLVVDEIEADDRRLKSLAHTVGRWIDVVQRSEERKWRAVRESIHNLHLADLSQKLTMSTSKKEGDTQ